MQYKHCNPYKWNWSRFSSKKESYLAKIQWPFKAILYRFFMVSCLKYDTVTYLFWRLQKRWYLRRFKMCFLTITIKYNLVHTIFFSTNVQLQSITHKKRKNVKHTCKKLKKLKILNWALPICVVFNSANFCITIFHRFEWVNN